MSEPTTLDPSAAAALVAAAAGACPPDAPDWSAQVRARAFDLLRLVPDVVERAGVLAACRPVTGILAKVEESKGRGVITIHATMGEPAPDQEVVDGRPVEYVRTAWLSEPTGRALFEQARGLRGRHVRFGKWVEQIGPRKKVSMVEWMEDLGPAAASGSTSASAPVPAGGETGNHAPRAMDHGSSPTSHMGEEDPFRPVATPAQHASAPTGPVALCSDAYRKALVSMAKRVSEPAKRQALENWMKANGVPPFISPHLTAEQAARARSFLAHIDDMAGAA